jgi:hypothetical protein
MKKKKEREREKERERKKEKREMCDYIQTVSCLLYILYNLY